MISSNLKLALVLGALALLQGLWSKSVLDSKNKFIDELVDKIEAKEKMIETRDREISELKHHKQVEDGLKLIIDYQQQRQKELSDELDNLRANIHKSVRELSGSERSEGKEIDFVWDFYEESLR